MRLFLDTANFKEVRHGVELGVISGVTTNPTLVAKEGHPDFKAAVREICGLVDGPVSAEVLSLDRQGMMREAREVAGWAPNVVVKLPITADGLAATSVLSREGIKINLTLCFSANQALLAALAGATFVSPFVGRLDDAGHDGMAIVADIAQVFARCHYTTQVLAASIRHPLHCVVAAKAGADVATIPYKVLMQMIQHPLTDIGIARFLEDWRKVYEREEVKTL
ncbi:MAG: fructose-6-phosphate aldolase [Chloroflexi bacterium]|nr:fructose-6-phosphate aldolase [Chloroflexota bacterium]